LASEILPANGSTELIYLLPRLVKGSRALIIAPAFSEYAKALEAGGWEVDYHFLSPDEGFELKLDSLNSRMAERYDMLFLCNPGNPTGRLYTREEVHQVAELCRAYGTFFVLDEAFIDFCGEDASSLAELVSTNSGVLLRSLTKFYAIPGLRLGYAAASSEICERLAEIRGPWSVNALAQAAGLSAIGDAQYRAATMELVSRERATLYSQLSEISGLAPVAGAANYLLVRVENNLPVSELRDALLARRSILIRDCSSFTGLGAGFFRVAVRSGEENELLIESLKELLPQWK
jgi:threonine-phosphate decarboxylase